MGAEAQMIVACGLSAMMSFGIAWQGQLAGPADAFGVSCFRVAGNVLFVLLWTLLARPGRSQKFTHRDSGLLAAWGLLGAVTIACMFAAVERIGIGNASFLVATSGAVTAALAPRFLGQKNGVRAWTGITLSLVGVFALRAGIGDAGATAAVGWAYGLASGVAAGLAYLAVAKLGPTRSPRTIMIAWTIACVAAHAAYAFVETPRLPTAAEGWIALTAAGLAAATSQWLTARSYALGSAATLAALSGLAPLFTMAGEVALFRRNPTGLELAGCGLILAAMLVLSRFTRSLPNPRTLPAEA